MILIYHQDEIVYSLKKNTYSDDYFITWNDVISIKDNTVFDLPPKSSIYIATTNRFNDHYDFKKVNYYPLGLLKSNLQKCVRRNKVDKAVKTAYQLINQNINEFLRRLIIIIVEDSIIHPDMLFCMWLYMAITKGYTIQSHQVYKLLKIVYDITLCNCKDVIINNFEFILYKQSCKKKIINDEENEIIDKLDKCCLSMLLRTLYGGMDGDMNMLKSSVKIWKNRILKNKKIWIDFLSYIWDFKKFNIEYYFFCNKDILIEAIDFHSFGDPFLHKIMEIHTDLSQIDIKKSIWHFRSGINNKTCICNKKNYTDPFSEEDKNEEKEKYVEIWNKIKNDVDRISILFYKF